MSIKPSHILGMNSRHQYTALNKASAKQYGFSKLKTKELLNAQHIPTAQVYHVFESLTDLNQVNWDTIPTPFVIKPASGSAGKGILLIKKRQGDNLAWLDETGQQLKKEDLDLHVHNILDGEYSTWGSNHKAIVEELIPAHPKLADAYIDRNELDLFMTEGRLLSQSEVTEKISIFLQMHNLSERFKVVWSASFVSRTTITSDTIKLRLPVDFRQEGLLGMLYHEIGTHALRRINYEQQPWYKKKNKFGFGPYLRTEEGLAALHALIPHSYKSAFVSALRYLAVDVAQRGSFADLWQFLTPYVQDIDRRWIIAVREKRGLTDTSRPGGFSKDLVYFEGLVEVWQWLSQHDFDISLLYYGKLGYKDVMKAQELNPNFQPLLPSFFQLNQADYQKELEHIGKFNNLGIK